MATKRTASFPHPARELAEPMKSFVAEFAAKPDGALEAVGSSS
ncbi:MAG: hypothetical protein WDM96_19260 [Lacunisphaera sp.]